MGISIKDEAVEASIRKLAALTGKSVTQTVGEAVEAALVEQCVERKYSREERLAKIRHIAQEVKAIPVRDPRSIREMRNEISDESLK